MHDKGNSLCTWDDNISPADGVPLTSLQLMWMFMACICAYDTSNTANCRPEHCRCSTLTPPKYRSSFIHYTA